MNNNDKMDPKWTASIFLGYAANRKGYRLYDLQNNSFFISRDVIFYENVYPFKGYYVNETPLFVENITPCFDPPPVNITNV